MFVCSCCSAFIKRSMDYLVALAENILMGKASKCLLIDRVSQPREVKTGYC